MSTGVACTVTVKMANNSDPCAGGGAYIGCNYDVNSVCVNYIDAPVNPSTFAC